VKTISIGLATLALNLAAGQTMPLPLLQAQTFGVFLSHTKASLTRLQKELLEPQSIPLPLAFLAS
jgi:hypothetical protein